MDAGWIAHVFPGLGNPMTDIDIGDFNGYLSKIGPILKMESGDMTDRDIVEMEAGI